MNEFQHFLTKPINVQCLLPVRKLNSVTKIYTAGESCRPPLFDLCFSRHLFSFAVSSYSSLESHCNRHTNKAKKSNWNSPKSKSSFVGGNYFHPASAGSRNHSAARNLLPSRWWYSRARQDLSPGQTKANNNVKRDRIDRPDLSVRHSYILILLRLAFARMQHECVAKFIESCGFRETSVPISRMAQLRPPRAYNLINKNPKNQSKARKAIVLFLYHTAAAPSPPTTPRTI